jgi:DNA-binding NarL/FixJ family response regulator
MTPIRVLLASLSEVEVVTESHTIKQIAQTLGISVETVETHRARIMERLDIHDLPGWCAM